MNEPVEITQMPRRAFLAWGSALAAGAFGGRMFRLPALPVTGSTGAQPAGIAIGYGAPLMTEAADLVEAQTLSAGDAEFVRHGARVSILGLEGLEAALASDGLKSLSLDVSYPHPDGGEALLVHAWHFASGPVRHVSPGNSFVVPVGHHSGLSLVLEAEDASGTSTRSVCQFTVGGETDLPKLQRGIYVLAPSDSTAWQGLGWTMAEDGRPRLVRRSALGGALAGVEFPCLAMTVDYARDCAAALVDNAAATKELSA